MNKDTVLTATGLYYSVINHLIGQEINSEGKLNASLHSDSAEIDFGKPGKNNERCNMIKINGTACCSSLKYLQGVNIYQQSVKRHRIAAIRATLERGMARPDGCELVFFFPRKHNYDTCFDVRALRRCLGMLHKTAAPF